MQRWRIGISLVLSDCYESIECKSPEEALVFQPHSFIDRRPAIKELCLRQWCPLVSKEALHLLEFALRWNSLILLSDHHSREEWPSTSCFLYGLHGTPWFRKSLTCIIYYVVHITCFQPSCLYQYHSTNHPLPILYIQSLRITILLLKHLWNCWEIIKENNDVCSHKSNRKLKNKKESFFYFQALLSDCATIV